MPTLDEQITTLPLDDFSKLVVRGAMRVVVDAENPIRLNLFAAAIRELFGHTLHRLAPDGEVMACDWFKFEEGQKKPTRRQRAKYATQGGLPDEFIRQAGIDVERLHDAAIMAVDTLSKYTHVREGVIVQDPVEIDTFVGNALGALVGLFGSFTSCRSQIEEAVYEQVNDESVSALLYETIQSLDEIATHHSIDEIYVDDVKVARIDASTIHFDVSGSVSVQLQWGSNSDVARDEGALMDKSFPFRVTMWSPVKNVTAFEDTDYIVDTGSWWDGYYDEDEIGSRNDTKTAATESDLPF
jgi:hypothetical protein